MAHNNHFFGMGDLTGDIFYDIFTLNNKQVPFLRLIMFIAGSKEAMPIEGLRVVAYGDLAELCHSYLQKGSRIAVIGHVQRRYVRRAKKEVWEIVAESLSFVRNIDWETGESARQRLMAGGKEFKATRIDPAALGQDMEFIESKRKPAEADIQAIQRQQMDGGG